VRTHPATVAVDAAHAVNQVSRTSTMLVSASEGSSHTNASCSSPGTTRPTATVTGKATARAVAARRSATRSLLAGVDAVSSRTGSVVS